MQKEKSKNQKLITLYPIYVQPLPNDISEAQIKLLFSLCGQIAKLRLFKSSNKTNKAAFINFYSQRSSLRALKFYQNKLLDNFSLDIHLRSIIYEKKSKLQNQKIFHKLSNNNFDTSTVYDEQEFKQKINLPKKQIKLNESNIQFFQREDKQKGKNKYKSKGNDKNKKNIQNFKTSYFQNKIFQQVNKSDLRSPDKNNYKNKQQRYQKQRKGDKNSKKSLQLLNQMSQQIKNKHVKNVDIIEEIEIQY